MSTSHIEQKYVRHTKKATLRMTVIENRSIQDTNGKDMMQLCQIQVRNVKVEKKFGLKQQFST